MPSKFIHAIIVERVTWDEGTIDDDGQPTASTAAETDVSGLVQPKRTGGSATAEIDDYRSAGSEISDHVIFLPDGTDVRNDDVLRHGTRRYQITGIRRFEYGGLAHLEVDARLITPVPSVAAAGS